MDFTIFIRDPDSQKVQEYAGNCLILSKTFASPDISFLCDGVMLTFPAALAVAIRFQRTESEFRELRVAPQ